MLCVVSFEHYCTYRIAVQQRNTKCSTWNISTPSPQPDPLLSQPGCKGFHRVHVIEDDFECPGDRDGEYQTDGPPDPSPEQQGDRHGQRIQLETAAQHLWIEN